MEHRLTPTIYSVEAAEIVSSVARCPTAVFVKVDAGLGRLGVPLSEALTLISRIAGLDNVVVEGVYTHLSFYDQAGKEWARGRLAAFDAFLDSLESAGISIQVLQAISSSNVLTGLNSKGNAVCPGSLLYGVCPVARELADMSLYRPVLRAIKSRLIHIGPLKSGGRVGVIPLGVVDGYRPILPTAMAYGLILGRRARITGVSLEHACLNLADIEDAHVGDEVVLLGSCGDEEITLYDIAGWTGAHPLHVLMSFNRRIPCNYSGEPD